MTLSVVDSAPPVPNMPALAAPSPSAVAIVRQSTGVAPSPAFILTQNGLPQESGTVRILLTGSSGRVGRNLLLDGLAARHQVTAFDWAPPRPAGQCPLPGRQHPGPQGPFRCHAGGRGRHPPGRHPLRHSPLHQVFHINVQGTYHALELAVEHGVRHFLHASSLMAYGFGRNAEAHTCPSTRTTRPPPTTPTGRQAPDRVPLPGLHRQVRPAHPLLSPDPLHGIPSPLWRPLPYDDDSGIQGLHEYIESRDLVELLEAALSSERVRHDVFLASGPDSGHLLPTPEVIRKYHPKAECATAAWNRNLPSSPWRRAAGCWALLPAAVGGNTD